MSKGALDRSLDPHDGLREEQRDGRCCTLEEQLGLRHGDVGERSALDDRLLDALHRRPRQDRVGRAGSAGSPSSRPAAGVPAVSMMSSTGWPSCPPPLDDVHDLRDVGHLVGAALVHDGEVRLQHDREAAGLRRPHVGETTTTSPSESPPTGCRGSRTREGAPGQVIDEGCRNLPRAESP